MRAGAIWIATNTDRTLPSRAGATARQRFAGRRAAYGTRAGPRRGGRQAGAGAVRDRRRRSGGAAAAGGRVTGWTPTSRAPAGPGMDSLLVLTGVSGRPELLAAEPRRRPTYVARDLAGLFDPAAAVRVPGPADAGGWSVTDRDGTLELAGAGRPLDALAALCAVAWSAPVPALPKIRPLGPDAAHAVESFGLTAAA